MLIKLMSSENLADDSPMKGCRLIEGVQEARFRHLDTGEAALDVQYRSLNRGLDSETFLLQANVYLMNDSGKTIQAFSANPAEPAAA